MPSWWPFTRQRRDREHQRLASGSDDTKQRAKSSNVKSKASHRNRATKSRNSTKSKNRSGRSKNRSGTRTAKECRLKGTRVQTNSSSNSKSSGLDDTRKNIKMQLSLKNDRHPQPKELSKREKLRQQGEYDERVKHAVSMREFMDSKSSKDFGDSGGKTGIFTSKTTGRHKTTMTSKAERGKEGPRKKFDQEKFPYQEFLDKHYERIQPGIRKATYTFSEYEQVTMNACDVLAMEKTLVEIDPPVFIVGDIHGQFNDLINMFLLLGRPPDKKYLFLGDYVDRGGMSLQVIMLLLAYKTYYPENIYLLRGNHECPRVNKRYGFYDDCMKLPDGELVWALFQRAFNVLPICALVGGKILGMHGGLSPELDTLENLREIKRPLRNPFRGVISDMLWADPTTQVKEWRNSKRGSGWLFGTDVIADTCERLHIDMIVRAHQVCYDGFWAYGRLITLFSAPSYCNQYVNCGAVLDVEEDLKCTMVAFAPDVNNAKERIVGRHLLWEDSLDRVAPQ